MRAGYFAAVGLRPTQTPPSVAEEARLKLHAVGPALSICADYDRKAETRKRPLGA